MPYGREDLAWAAGFYEGEGTVCASYSQYTTKKGNRYTRKTPQRQLVIGQIYTEPLERFKAAVGVGGVYGPYQKGDWSPAYQYRVRSFEEVQAVIAMIWPWLSERRREQAKAVLTAGKR